ncbi:MAG: alpha/beta hydrolase [Clostridia bacterium]|nr:alpha/beta hydrolase [Clostridia bacterium]
MVQKKKAIIVICPGGAYQWLSPRESEPIARAFEAMGYETSILRYTVQAEGDPEPLGLGPVRELSERVAQLRETTDGAPIFVCGFSAGGHLAATLGVHWKTLGLSRPDGLILCYPVITADEALCNAPSIQSIAGEDRRDFFSLEKHVSADTPPTFLWHTAEDHSVPVENSLMFAAALRRFGVPFEMHIYPFGEHGLSLATDEVTEYEKGRLPDAHVAGWIRECGDWIETVLGRKR